MRFVNEAGLNQAPLRSRRIINQRLIKINQKVGWQKTLLLTFDPFTALEAKAMFKLGWVLRYIVSSKFAVFIEIT
jgi:hypothetical protein